MSSGDDGREESGDEELGGLEDSEGATLDEVGLKDSAGSLEEVGLRDSGVSQGRKSDEGMRRLAGETRNPSRCLKAS